jgi:hypothetical protein
MARTVYGVARVNGLVGGATVVGLWSGGGTQLVSADVTDETQVEDFLVNGGVLGFARGEHLKGITIDFVPTGGTTIANAQAACVLPSGPCVVTLANFAITSLNTTWIYEKGGRLSVGDKDATMTLPLIKGTGDTTTLTTPIVA